ncbi:MAG: hypothetical protein ACM4AI_25005, partial [Acidobacteriota bacterium]
LRFVNFAARFDLLGILRNQPASGPEKHRDCDWKESPHGVEWLDITTTEVVDFSGRNWSRDDL